MLNRGAIVLKYKEFAIKWLNDNDPYDDASGITIEQTLNDGSTIYLISDDDAESEHSVEAWVKNNYKQLFETELEGWLTDETLWPKKLTYSLFQKWFSIEWHSMLIDTVNDVIDDDEMYEDDVEQELDSRYH